MAEKKIKLIKEITNDPYLSLINYCIGNYSTFKYSMIEAIKKDIVFKDRWTDYSQSNDGIVLVEMWAYLLDILSYYQERIANEAFIRTAQLRESVIRQCQLIDYKLSPGVSATTFVQFIAEKDRSGIVSTGFKLQTKPISGKEPLVFETDEEIFASSKLNDINLAVPKIRYSLQTGVKLNGRYDNLKSGDFILVVKKDLEFGDPQYGTDWAVTRLVTLPIVLTPSSVTATTIASATTTSQNDATRVITELGWEDIGSSFDSENSQVYLLSISMYVFGYNAPSMLVLKRLYQDPNDSDGSKYTPAKLPGKKSDQDTNQELPKNNLRLDRIYDGLKINDFVVVMDQMKVAASSKYSDATKLFQITKISETIAINYGLSSRVTILTVDRNFSDDMTDLTDGFDIRSTLVLGKPIELSFVEEDIDESQRKIKVEGVSKTDKPRTLLLDTVYTELKEGMYISMTDTGQIDDFGYNISEIHRITSVTKSEDGGLSNIITVAEPFEHEFDKVTTKLNANVAPASQGETIKDEILGSGDASEQYQEFLLKQMPVTFTPSALENTGAKNSLEIFVNNVKWQEVEGFVNSMPTDRHYMTSIDEEDKMSATFGNGKYGSLLPTGMDNIHAKYRKGIGAAGNLAYQNTITVIMGTNPALKSVTNQIGSSGGADKENEDDARVTAPRSLKALHRAVSIEDYQNLALSYTGIAKAKAYIISQFQQVGRGGRQRQSNYESESIIGIIIAPKTSENGIEHATDTTKRNLRNYLDLRRDPNIPLKIQDFNSVTINITAKIKVKEQYLQLAVKKAVETALGRTTNKDKTYNFFAFDRLDFGQSIYLSDIYSAIAKIEGVEYAIIQEFNKSIEVDLIPLAQYVRVKENEIADLGELTILADGGIS